jgi:hypothetical protein
VEVLLRERELILGIPGRKSDRSADASEAWSQASFSFQIKHPAKAGLKKLCSSPNRKLAGNSQARVWCSDQAKGCLDKHGRVVCRKLNKKARPWRAFFILEMIWK